MIILTYQSKLVWEVLKSGSVYRAKPNLMLRGEYEALIDLLGLRCECPVFGVVKGKKQNTGGKVSGSVRLALDVPKEAVRFTEYGVWADFLYAFRFTMPGNYKSLRPDCEEITSRQYQEILEDLQTQRSLSEYSCPQAVLEKIDPSWVKSVSHMGKDGLFGRLFRK